MGTLVDDLRKVADEGRHLDIKLDVLRIKLKEKLQIYVLDYIYNNPNYKHLIMYGGTCLRVCYNLNRMSEDIDFETTKPFDKKQFATHLKDYFSERIQYKALTAPFPGQRINRVELRLPILFELGLSSHEEENLILKIEVNKTEKNYPTTFKVMTELRSGFVIRHYPLEILMAGKVLACLDRVWKRSGASIKGRDFYDLLWYMEKGIIPDKNYLAERGGYSLGEAFQKLREKMEKIKPADVLADLEHFFENPDFPRQWVNIMKDQFSLFDKKYQEKF